MLEFWNNSILLFSSWFSQSKSEYLSSISVKFVSFCERSLFSFLSRESCSFMSWSCRRLLLLLDLYSLISWLKKSSFFCWKSFCCCRERRWANLARRVEGLRDEGDGRGTGESGRELSRLSRDSMSFCKVLRSEGSVMVRAKVWSELVSVDI